MKWAEGIDKLGIFLYLAISLFAIANIYSVDEGLEPNNLYFWNFLVNVGLVIFTMRTKFFENFAGIFHIRRPFISRFTCFGTEILGQKLVQVWQFYHATCRICKNRNSTYARQLCFWIRF